MPRSSHTRASSKYHLVYLVGEKASNTWRGGPADQTIVMSNSALSLNYIRSRKKKTQRPRVGWHKPPEGVYMVNVDVSFNPETHVAASGVVIRDSNGGFVAARCFRID